MNEGEKKREANQVTENALLVTRGEGGGGGEKGGLGKRERTCDGHRVMDGSAEFIHYTPETNVTLYGN